MSDYQREVYYVYNYEHGQKRNNVGFVRIERFHGQCRMTSRIRVPSMNGKTLKVCLFIRVDGEIQFLPLGSMQISNMAGECRMMLNTRNILGMGYGMEEISGMVIYDSEDKFFGSEWDDERIAFREFKLAEKREEEKEEQLMAVSCEEVSFKEADTQSWEKTYGEEGENSKEMNAQSQENMCGSKGENSKEASAKSQENMYGSKGENFKEADGKLQGEYDDLGGIRKSVDFGKPERLENSGFDVAAEAENSNLEAAKEQETFCGQEWKEREENLLPVIFSQFPRMQPFEDDEMTDCVRIEPQDIGRLPMESWVLANNSFLLHSYYSYRHLMLARRNCEHGYEYVLCVPGICQNREQFMAALFGFSDFKPVKNAEDTKGEFGYWYMPVVVEA